MVIPILFLSHESYISYFTLIINRLPPRAGGGYEVAGSCGVGRSGLGGGH